MKINKLNEYFVVISGGFMAILTGMALGWFAPNSLLLGQYFGLKQNEIDILPTFTLLGTIPGIIISNILSNKYGRIKSSFISTITFVISFSILLINTSNPIMFYISRFLAGFVPGATFITIPTYICEVASPNKRGFYSCIFMFQICFGTILEYILVPILPFQMNLVIVLLFGFVFLFLCCILPESFYWLISKNQMIKAEKSLKFIRNKSDVKNELKKLKEFNEKENKEKGAMFDLIRIKTNRKSLFILGLVFFAQQANGFGIILQFSQQILKKANCDIISPELSGVFFITAKGLSALIASPFSEKFGRRILLIFSNLAVGICNVLLGTFFYLQYKGLDDLTKTLQLVPFVILICASISYAFGLGSAAYALMSEVFPTNVRSHAGTAISIIGAIFGLVSNFIYLFCVNNLGYFSSFYSYAFISFATTIGFYFFIFETKGQSLEEIQMKLKGYQNS